MKNSDFDPNGVGIPNGNYFGFPFDVEESNVVLVSVPWDVTTSYSRGASKGPNAIIEASTQLDFFDPEIPDAWKIGIATEPVSEKIVELNELLRPMAEEIIKHLEDGGYVEDNRISNSLMEINNGSRKLNEEVFERCRELLSKDKLVAIVGGDHSSPYGLIKALSEKYNEFGVLQIDAHADLRIAYEGFEHSHASIMQNILEFKNLIKLVQLAIRDLSEDEAKLARDLEKISIKYDFELKENEFKGINWNKQCSNIISELPENVYLSFDIDGLDPMFCPNTGTPVPGGLTYNQVIYLIEQLVKSGRKIIGFDLCEVAPGNDEWDANVGARLLYKLSNLMYISNQG